MRRPRKPDGVPRTLRRMILSTGVPMDGAVWLAALSIACYGVSAVTAASVGGVRWFAAAVAVHALMLLHGIGSLGLSGGQVRLGFGPVLSLTLCLALAVHAWQRSFIALTPVRRWLAAAGALSVLLGGLFPGELRSLGSPWGPLHWLLGVGAYGLFAAAVVHALLLDSADRRLRLRKGPPVQPTSTVPLLHIERITFGYVQAGFATLSASIALGIATVEAWRWDHKTVLSMLAWLIFAVLLAGRRWRGWRGSQATLWLYAGDLVLMLAYVGSRFVTEVLLGRTTP